MNDYRSALAGKPAEENAVSTSDGQGDHRAHRLAPLSERQGAQLDDITGAAQEHPVDAIAVARKIAKEQA